jgi:hypothetical protein
LVGPREREADEKVHPVATFNYSRFLLAASGEHLTQFGRAAPKGHSRARHGQREEAQERNLNGQQVYETAAHFHGLHVLASAHGKQRHVARRSVERQHGGFVPGPDHAGPTKRRERCNLPSRRPALLVDIVVVAYTRLWSLEVAGNRRSRNEKRALGTDGYKAIVAVDDPDAHVRKRPQRKSSRALLPQVSARHVMGFAGRVKVQQLRRRALGQRADRSGDEARRGQLAADRDRL